MTMDDVRLQVPLSNEARGIMALALKVAQVEVMPDINMTDKTWAEPWSQSIIKNRERLNTIAYRIKMLREMAEEAANEST